MSDKKDTCGVCKVPNEDAKELEEFEFWNEYKFCGHSLSISLSKGDFLGAHVWDAALVLCAYFETENISFAGKKVIELGSGTGIVGILAVLLGGDVTFTDQTFLLKQIEHNIAVNIPSSCKGSAKVSALSWGDDQMNFLSEYDVILGSDIVYCLYSYPSLLKTLIHLSEPETTIYIACQMWPKNVQNSFFRDMLPKHFHLQLIDEKINDSIYVYKLSKKHLCDGDQLADSVDVVI